MNNRLIQKIREQERSQSKLFCAYLTLGYPNLSTTETLISAFEQAGVDIVELGFPFSDPLADGPTIQFASAQAIRRGVGIRDAFHLIRKLRRKGVSIPILFFSYLNPIMHYGVSRAVRQLHQSGFDGLIVPDLPPEEGRMWESWFKRSDLSIVYLVAPTTRQDRIKEIARHSNGFIYYVSLKGVTGARSSIPTDLVKKIKAVKQLTRKRVLVGFGVSRPDQVKTITRVADGIIVGSAIVERLKGGRKGIRSAISLVAQLSKAAKRAQ
ncbi:MAG: tryptophan synthase subunit alpha [Candidatus Omnitrophica bacterium]|nr:tryptophan synthase subunit alpha [Candidatus Omnitrophota bacterium]